MQVRQPLRLCCVLSVALSLSSLSAARASDKEAPPTKKPDPREVAGRVDAALFQSLDKGVHLPAAVDDEAFLRRASLDLTGKLPTVDQLRAFVADLGPDKRARVVERLLNSDAYAVNWGRYWRDVLTYHTPASANYLRWDLFNRWLVEQVRRNRSWGEIVTALVTATGINDENAPVNFLTSHFGNQVEVAATTSRVFLGVQLQCAQCHNAKTEPWTREQFHEFVAFFGRARLIQHKDVENRGTPYAIEGRSDGQYCMADKKDPNRLLEMTPRFLTGEAVSREANDAERRAALARFLTSPKNPWFARAYVNRMWTTLMGWGFYSGLADLGSESPPRYPEVLDLLAREWTATGYDMQWLFRTLTLTETYQRRLQPRSDAQAPGPAVCPARLRPEQIFEALVQALGVDENDKSIPAPAPNDAPAVTRHSGLRHMVYQAFKADPSLPPEEVRGTIPQALLMMNSALVHTATAARGKAFLADALAKQMNDEDLLVALYERTLARKPKPEEVAICQRYLKKVGSRDEAFEDIFWGLINSTEFLMKK